MSPALIQPVAKLGAVINDGLASFGSTMRFTLRAYAYGFVGLVRPRVYDRRELLRQIEVMGGRSLPLILFVAFLIGAGVMAQTVPDFQRRGTPEVAPGVLAIMITRFIAPVITALLFAGRIGASLAAEVGAMKLGEELDALQAMGARPIAFVAAPRVMAVGIALAGLTLVFEVVALLGGFLMGVASFGISAEVFAESVRYFIVPYDVAFAVAKAFCYAIGIAAVALHRGFQVEGGSAELGRATMGAVVACQAVIIAIDLFCAMVNNVLQAWQLVPTAPV
ncbi:MAG: putative phospholipid ABC transporter permease protein MlaE [Planctomycetes bacterium]|nr:putative phospholipid ABC transporter permease protein MlaE [Planctomycetota bacterium]